MIKFRKATINVCSMVPYDVKVDNNCKDKVQVFMTNGSDANMFSFFFSKVNPSF